MADFTVRDEGSIILFTPNTAAAKAWLEDNVSEDAMYFGPALCVEHRFAENLLEGICEAGYDWTM